MKNFRNSRPVRNSGTVGVESTYPISSETRSLPPVSVRRVYLPESDGISPLIQLKRVVLPAPFLPRRPYILPDSKLKVISLKTSLLSNFLDRCYIENLMSDPPIIFLTIMYPL